MDHPQPNTHTRTPPSKRKGRGRSDASWLEKHGVKCDSYAEERAVLASRGDMLTAWGIVSDESGQEATRQLVPLSDDYRALALRAAWLIDDDGIQHRDFTKWSARAVVAVAVFCARNCMPSEFHGATVYRVAGFSMGFFRMLCGLLVWVDGGVFRKRPSRSTFGHVAHKRRPDPMPDGWEQPEERGWIGDLAKVGLLEAFQFDACDVTPQQRGPVHDDGTQWALIQFFLLVRPWPPGMDGPGQLPKKKNAKLRIRTIGRTLMERLQLKARHKSDREHGEVIQRDRESPLRAAGRLAAASAVESLDRLVKASLSAPESPAASAYAESVADRLLAGVTPAMHWRPPPD